MDSNRRPKIRGRDVTIPMIPPPSNETGGPIVLSLPDGEHEVAIRYLEKQVMVEVRKKATNPTNPNQLWLELT